MYYAGETVTDFLIFMFWNAFKKRDAQNKIYVL